MAHVARESAIELEQTIPKLLLERAYLNRTRGHQRMFRQLLNQIVQGDWQPRYSATVKLARKLSL